MSELMIFDEQYECTSHDGVGKINDVLKLLDEYSSSKKEIIDLHNKVMGHRYSNAFSYFVSGAGHNSLHETLRIERFFELDQAICALDQDFWNRLIDVINVKNFMPADKREKWYDDLNKWRKADKILRASVRPLPFERETVLMTAKTLSDERKEFFTDMVDGVFKKLSPRHFTNHAEGFSVRMIVANAMPSVDRQYDNQEYINDLRKIIGLMFNRQDAESVTSHRLFDDLTKYYGEWVPVDGGAFELKPHKNGTVHIQISQNIADSLNAVLASRYPNVIPLKKKRGEKRYSDKFINDKNYFLRSEYLPFKLCEYFGEVARNTYSKSRVVVEGMTVFDYSLPSTYMYCESIINAAERIFKMIGGYKDDTRTGYYRFTYDPKPVFENLFINGTLPDQESHQFYATKGEIRSMTADLAEIRQGHTLLEPAAGFGDLLLELPDGVNTTAVEIHPVAASLLRAKGFRTIEQDFLTVTPAETGLYDRVLMNPPYSNGRWSRHLRHAITFIKPGGKLVAVLPASAVSDANECAPGEGYDVSFSKTYAEAFEGALVSVRIMTIDRHE